MDTRAVFPILADVSGYGVDVDQMQEGWSPTAKNGMIGFAFKDSAGNVVLPQLSPTGQIYVSPASPGTKKKARGEYAAGSATSVLVTGSTIALTAGKTYVDLNMVCSCRQPSLFQVIWNDNGVETILVDAVVDAGQYTVPVALNDEIFVAGAIGTQELYVKAYNFSASKLSALRATIDILEAA